MKEKEEREQKRTINVNTKTPGALDVEMFMMRQELARKEQEKDKRVIKSKESE